MNFITVIGLVCLFWSILQVQNMWSLIYIFAHRAEAKSIDIPAFQTWTTAAAITSWIYIFLLQ